MKETGKKLIDTKTMSAYPSMKTKAMTFSVKSDKYSTSSYDTRSILSGTSTGSIYRETAPSSLTSTFSVRFDDTAPSNETRAYVWAVALKNERLISRLVVNDNDIKNVSLDLPNQRVIKNDCLRTRVGIFTDSMRDNLEKLLTFYCKREKITYKQGMNEVAAPFIYFMDAQVNLSNIYNYLVLFIDRFLPTSFIDKDFLSLQCYFRTLELLIKYHDPNFHTFLTINDLPSELYATPWFLTLFASKMNLDMVYFLWDIYILENDTCFKFFVGLALLLENKNAILGSETSMIPQTIANLTIQNAFQMRQIYKKAIDLRMRTPASFLGKLRDLDIFKRDYLSDSDMKSSMEKTVEYLESLQSVLVSSHEIINSLYYNTEITCSDSECANYRQPGWSEAGTPRDSRNRASSSDFVKKEKKARKANTPKESAYFDSSAGYRKRRPSREFKSECILCQAQAAMDVKPTPLSTMPHLKDLVNYKQDQKAEFEDEPALDFFIIDLRQNKNSGLLPRSYQVKFTKQLEETINSLINDYIELQSQCHFVFMTTNFNSWVFKDLVESKQTKSKKTAGGTLKSERHGFKGSISIEDEWLMAFLNAFIQNGFPYLSILEGGFNEINKNLHTLNLETVNHNPEYCAICRGSGGVKGPSFLNFVTKVIDKTGEKIGMLVEGMNQNTSFSEGNRGKGRASIFEHEAAMSKTSQGFFNFKKDDEIKSPLPNRNRDLPQSDSTQETGEYFPPPSPMYNNSEPGSGPSNNLSKFLNANYTSEDYSNTYKSTRFEASEGTYGGSAPVPHKITTSSSTYKLTHQASNPPKTIHQSGSQSSFVKSNSVFYNQSLMEPKTDFGVSKMTYAASGSTTMGLHTTPKAEISEFMYKDRRGINHQDFLSDDGDDLKIRKQSSSQEKRSAVPMHANNKAKSNDKLITYNNYAAPSLAKMFKPTKQEEDLKTKFYSTEFSLAKPFGQDNGPNKDMKDTSLVESFYTEAMTDNKSRPGSLYNTISTPKAFLESYTKQMNPAVANSNSKKGTITQILKETTVSLAQASETGGESNMSSYQPFTKSSLMTYAVTPQDDITKRSQPDSNIYLENLGGDLLSTREMNSLRTITQSPSPEKTGEGKITDRIELKKKDMMIDTGMTYSNYTDFTSPIQVDMLKSALNRVEEGKASSRPQISNESSYYEKNGIFKEVKLSQNSVFWLYKTFENVEFSLYACEFVKDPAKDELSASTMASSTDILSKRIMIVSKDFLMTLEHSQEVMDDLKLLQVGVSVERILKRTRDKSYGKGYQSVYDNFDKSLLSPKEYLKDRDSFNTLDTLGAKKYDVTLLSIFPVKLLLRITSKKADAKYLSFYFKLPTLDKIQAMNASRFFNFSEHTIQELPYLMKKEEYIRMLREVSDLKDAPTGLLQSKSLYSFENESNAQECIQKTKDAYSYASSYINERLKKNIRI